jgi:uncharacterized protein with FMN-binding domain
MVSINYFRKEGSLKSTISDHQSKSNLPKPINTTVTGVLVFAVIVLMSSATIALQNRDTLSNNNQTVYSSRNSAVNNSSLNTVFSSRTRFDDGEYGATGRYTSPGGPETISVKLKLENGVVQAAEVETHAESPVSRRFQREFANNFEPMVVGKKIVDLKLDKVAGSSLTSKGFNEALQRIRLEASSS